MFQVKQQINLILFHRIMLIKISISFFFDVMFTIELALFIFF